MLLKITGMIFVVTACSSVGFRMAANHRMEERALRQLVGILDYMECELQYRLTPLPELCRQAAAAYPGETGKVFLELSQTMDLQISPDMERCMTLSLEKVKKLPSITRIELELLGKSVGRFDLEGQLKGIEAVRHDCRRNLQELSNNRENRLRSYQTLGVCAGVALVILLI